jgi:type IV/VI secretion system ImpK/VasF family protein
VRADIKQILGEMRSKAGADPSLSQNYEKVELPLIYFVDQMIEESSLPFAREWADARLQTEIKGKTGGDEDFFDLLDETLKDQTEAGTERLSVYYTCLGLGFTGFYAGQPEYLRRKMSEMSARLRPMMDSDRAGRIVPEAYENVDTSDLVQPPGRSLVGIGLVLVVVAAAVVGVNAYLYHMYSKDLAAALQDIIGDGGGTDAASAE